MFQFARYMFRKVNGLALDGQIHSIFARKQKKLVPIVLCHGLFSNSEEFYGISMQLASHGYLVIVPDFQDGTALCATDKYGNDVQFGLPFDKKTHSDGKANMKWHEAFRARQIQRVNECYVLGQEIS